MYCLHKPQKEIDSPRDYERVYKPLKNRI